MEFQFTFRAPDGAKKVFNRFTNIEDRDKENQLAN